VKDSSQDEGRLRLALRPDVFCFLKKKANARGVSVNELLRTMVIPEWIAGRRLVQARYMCANINSCEWQNHLAGHSAG